MHRRCGRASYGTPGMVMTLDAPIPAAANAQERRALATCTSKAVRRWPARRSISSSAAARTRAPICARLPMLRGHKVSPKVHARRAHRAGQARCRARRPARSSCRGAGAKPAPMCLGRRRHRQARPAVEHEQPQEGARVPACARCSRSACRRCFGIAGHIADPSALCRRQPHETRSYSGESRNPALSTEEPLDLGFAGMTRK